jgi:hypothetical protein
MELHWQSPITHEECDIGLDGCPVCWIREVSRRYAVRPSNALVLPAWLAFVKQLGVKFMNGGYSSGLFASPDEYLTLLLQLSPETAGHESSRKIISQDLSGLFIEEKYCLSPACSSPTVKCQSETYRWEVSVQASGTSLSQKLNGLMSYRVMSEMSHCPCGVSSTRKTREYFSKAPRVLLVCLKRYIFLNDGRGVRISSESVPLQGSFQLQDPEGSFPVFYKLVAVICQSNSHCWAYVQQQDQWFLVNDVHVAPTTLESSHSTWTLAFFLREGSL